MLSRSTVVTYALILVVALVSLPTLLLPAVLGAGYAQAVAAPELAVQAQTAPSSISGLRLWLDAAAITGKTDGQAINQWDDLSGNAYHAAQGVADLQPTFRTGRINGQPAVRFDGYDSLSLSGNGLGLFKNLSGATLFIVYQTTRPPDGQANWVIVGSVNSTPSAARFGVNRGLTTPGRQEVRARGADSTTPVSVVAGSDFVAGAWSVMTVRVDYAAHTAALYDMGSVAGSNASFLTATSGTDNTNSSMLTIGSFNQVGGTFINGEIAEILVYGQALSDTERQQVEAYLNQKYFQQAPAPTATPTQPAAVPTATPTQPAVVPTATPTQPAGPTATPTVTPTPPPAGTQQIPLHWGWNWFSFKMAGITAPTAGSPAATGYFQDCWGSVTFNGQKAAAGTVVEAFSPRGDLVGKFTVSQEGYYGFMRVYGQDPQSGSPIVTPGMIGGETIAFKVNGYMATTVPSPASWSSAFDPARVDLIASNALPVTDVLGSIYGMYDYVLGEAGTYSVSAPYPGANTLTMLEPGKGYMIRTNQPGTTMLSIYGQPLPVGDPLGVASGWHWVGYLPDGAQTLPGVLNSIEGKYDYLLGEDGTYAPFGATFLNTLSNMEPGGGYIIRMRQPGTIVYTP